MVHLSYPYMTTGNTRALITNISIGSFSPSVFFQNTKNTKNTLFFSFLTPHVLSPFKYSTHLLDLGGQRCYYDEVHLGTQTWSPGGLPCGWKVVGPPPGDLCPSSLLSRSWRCETLLPAGPMPGRGTWAGRHGAHPGKQGPHSASRSVSPGVSTVARKKPSQSLWRRQIW